MMFMIHFSIVISLGVAIYNLDEFDILLDILNFMFSYSVPMWLLGNYLDLKLNDQSETKEEQMVR